MKPPTRRGRAEPVAVKVEEEEDSEPEPLTPKEPEEKEKEKEKEKEVKKEIKREKKEDGRDGKDKREPKEKEAKPPEPVTRVEESPLEKVCCRGGQLPCFFFLTASFVFILVLVRVHEVARGAFTLEVLVRAGVHLSRLFGSVC